MITTTSTFTAELRSRTAARHEAAEQSPLMAALVAGRLTAGDYGRLLAQLRPVYAALDAAATRWRTDRTVGGVLDARLDRTEAIARDLTFLRATHLPVTGAAAAYATRIDEVAQDWPAGVVAHHYTRYLGDLSGGQALAAILQRTIGLTAERGLAFYSFDFPGPPFKKAYRTLLDRAGWDDEERERFIAEVDHAFALNIALFDALADLVL